MNIILWSVGLILWISIYFESRSNSKVHNNILLEVTLPYTELKNDKVIKIVDLYNKANIKVALFSGLIFIPIMFIKYISLEMLAIVLWVALHMFLNNKIFKKYNEMLMSFKREIQNKLLNNGEKIIYTDNDEYWKKGIYNNPNDPRATIEKRTKDGMTWNMATKKGKLMIYGSYIFAIGVLGFVLTMMFMFDFVKFTMNIEGGRVNINAPIYSTSFSVDEIESVKLIEEIPSGNKTNGAATDRYALGHFNFKGYGKSEAYVYYDTKLFVEIKLKDGYVFINSPDVYETKEYYNELIELQSK